MPQQPQRRHLVTVVLASSLALTQLLNVAPVQANDTTYVVVPGDTLSQIAARSGVTVDDIVWLNGLADPNYIVVGEVLTLPSGADAPPAPAAPDTIQSLLVSTAHRYGWDPTLIMAQAWQESRWNQAARSVAGAVGVMQLMPTTGAQVAAWFGQPVPDPDGSAADNIELGVAYLTSLYVQTGSVSLALASYYQGWASLQRDGWFPDTVAYVEHIFRLQVQFAAGTLP